VRDRCCQATVSRNECQSHPKGEGGRRKAASQETCLFSGTCCDRVRPINQKDGF